MNTTDLLTADDVICASFAKEMFLTSKMTQQSVEDCVQEAASMAGEPTAAEFERFARGQALLATWRIVRSPAFSQGADIYGAREEAFRDRINTEMGSVVVELPAGYTAGNEQRYYMALVRRKDIE